MHKVFYTPLFFAVLLLSGCMGGNDETKEVSVDLTMKETVTEEVLVGPEKVDCVGVAEMKCLVVNGEFFYDVIEGFTHEDGYEYVLSVKKEQICDPNVFNDCPQDAGIHKYTLVEEISKTPTRK